MTDKKELFEKEEKDNGAQGTFVLVDEEVKVLNDSVLDEVVGGAGISKDEFNKITYLLKEAGDRAWAILGNNNTLWVYINVAEKANSVEKRKKAIDDALKILYKSKDEMSAENYDFIYKKLIESKMRNY